MKYGFLKIIMVISSVSMAVPTADGELQRVGAWPYGSSGAVDVDAVRPYVYLGSGGAVLVLDVSDPENPSLVSQSLRTAGVVEDLVYSSEDSILYAACDNGGLEIWDLSDPAIPAQLSAMEILYFGVETPVGNIGLSGNYIVAECNFGGVHTIDVSNPEDPQQVAFNAAMGNPALDASVDSSGVAHTTGAQYYMRLIINPDGSINSAGQKEFLYGAGTAAGNDEVAYVSYNGKMYILDLLLGGFPAWSITDVGGFSDIAQVGDHVLLVNDDGLQIWDVSNYSSPVLEGSLSQVPDYADRIVVKGDYAYVTNGSFGLSIIDISDLSDPALVGSYDVFSVTWAIDLDGDFAFLAHSDDGMLVLDISDPALPQLVGQVETTAEARDIDVSGDYAYVAAWTDGLRIMNISDPFDPFEASVYDQFDAWRVLIAGNIAWTVEAVPNQPDTLHAVDVSNPLDPAPMGKLPLYNLTWEIASNGNYLYTASHDSGMRIVDIADPLHPTEVGNLDIPSVYDLDMADNLLYVTAADGFDGGLFICDVDTPDSPVLLGSYQTTGFTPYHTWVEGDYAMVLDSDEIYLLNVSDPSNPFQVFSMQVPGFILTELEGSDGLGYVCAGDAGVQIIENTLATGIEQDEDSGYSGILPPNALSIHPNPSSAEAAITYTLTIPARVRVLIYDARGVLVASPAMGDMPAGEHTFTWQCDSDDGSRVPSGVYFCRVEAGGASVSGKLLIIR